MQINYIFRSKESAGFSIERVFNSIISYVAQNEIMVESTYVSESNAKFLSIIKNIICCTNIQGDIFHVTGDVHYVSLVLPRSRTILTIHDLVGIKMNKGFKKMLIKLLWYSLPIKHCQKITVISLKTYKDIVELYPKAKKKIELIPNPIDDKFKYNTKIFNKNCPTILQIGTKKNKNIYKVIDALRNINCALVIIGKLDSTQENYLKKNKINYINKFNLSDSQIVEEYNKCDVLMFVSTYEGFGMPIIEAQATGRIVITSNIEPMLSVAGKGAIFVNPEDANAIESALKKVIDNEKYREKIIIEGKYNSEKYNAFNITKQYTNLYESLYRRTNPKS